MTDLRNAIEDQLQRCMEGPAWHGPSVREALEGIGAKEAAQHPVKGAHSCWELVLHLSGTYGLVLRRMNGEATLLKPEEDWPPLPEVNEANWARDVVRLYDFNAQLRAAVLAFPIERLYAPLVPEPPYSAFTQFIGLTQHDLYHAGQIVLLKRALTDR